MSSFSEGSVSSAAVKTLAVALIWVPAQARKLQDLLHGAKGEGAGHNPAVKEMKVSSHYTSHFYL